MRIVLVFLRKNTKIHKNGRIHELCVSALSLVWFAGATPEIFNVVAMSIFPLFGHFFPLPFFFQAS